MHHVYAWEWLVASGVVVGLLFGAPVSFVAGWLLARRRAALLLGSGR